MGMVLVDTIIFLGYFHTQKITDVVKVLNCFLLFLIIGATKGFRIYRGVSVECRRKARCVAGLRRLQAHETRYDVDKPKIILSAILCVAKCGG